MPKARDLANLNEQLLAACRDSSNLDAQLQPCPFAVL